MLKKTISSIISAFKADDKEIVGGGDAEGGSVSGLDMSREKLIKSKSQTKSRQLGNSNATEESKFLISKAREAFNHLKQAFIKVSVLQYFDPKCYIRFKTIILGYITREVLS